jgi:hypothetical protein
MHLHRTCPTHQPPLYTRLLPTPLGCCLWLQARGIHDQNNVMALVALSDLCGRVGKHQDSVAFATQALQVFQVGGCLGALLRSAYTSALECTLGA